MSLVTDEYESRRQTESDIFQHLDRLYVEAAIGDAQIIELGVRSGNSTAAFLAAVETHGGYVWSVDVHPPDVDWSGHPQWMFIQGNDLAVADRLPGQVDVLFIDTSHLYRHTRAELDLYGPKVRAGGVILLHDTEYEFPDFSLPTDPPFPVRQAAIEYCNDHGYVAEFVAGCYGLGVIRIAA